MSLLSVTQVEWKPETAAYPLCVNLPSTTLSAIVVKLEKCAMPIVGTDGSFTVGYRINLALKSGCFEQSRIKDCLLPFVVWLTFANIVPDSDLNFIFDLAMREVIIGLCSGAISRALKYKCIRNRQWLASCTRRKENEFSGEIRGLQIQGRNGHMCYT